MVHGQMRCGEVNRDGVPQQQPDRRLNGEGGINLRDLRHSSAQTPTGKLLLGSSWSLDPVKVSDFDS